MVARTGPIRPGTAWVCAAFVALLVLAQPVLAQPAGTQTPTVVSVFPDADEVPANLLRIYVEFSEPMERGHVDEAVAVLDAGGKPIEGALLSIGREFWSPDLRRLTLIFDPGRIKSGLAPNRTNGAPLGGARSFMLKIGTAMRDGDGTPLAEPFRRSYAIGPDDHEGPDPDGWELEWDRTGAREALHVRFHHPVDVRTARRTLRIETAGGAPVPARLRIAPDGRSARFVARAPWPPDGSLRLAIHPTLEDPSGNRVGVSFDMAPGTVATMVHEVRHLPITRPLLP